MSYVLDTVKIERFKKLPNFEVKLANINILVGTNGSGKSSVLQGIHLACCALRQAPAVNTGGRVIPINELDYLPTDSYAELGNNSPWGNMETSQSSKITLTFTDTSSASSQPPALAWCELRAARNAGISVKGTIPTVVQEFLRKEVFSAYIPGISGIPNREEKFSKRVVQRACSFGDSNVYLRNILCLLQKEGKIESLVNFVNQVISPNKLNIEIKFQEEKDLAIQCFVSINHREQPIELIGTGYLQLIQIFAYILLLHPGLVLIDEPDNHLHPTIQEKMIPVLNSLANERGIKIILATHSPYIVRGAPLNAKVLWMKDGTMISDNRASVELSLGWGLMGKKLLIFSEDQNTDFLKKIISQWPDLERQIAIHPGNGYNNLIKPYQAAQIRATLQNSVKILIHRDRDALTDAEVEKLQKMYKDQGVFVWIPSDSDIESYFCNTTVISKIAGLTEIEAQTKLNDAISAKTNETADKFKSHRREHNNEIWPEGGSPANEDVWNELQTKPLKGAYGKGIFKELKQRILHNKFREESIFSTSFDEDLATDLKAILEQILSEEDS